VTLQIVRDAVVIHQRVVDIEKENGAGTGLGSIHTISRKTKAFDEWP
jgi:hypothetical protein